MVPVVLLLAALGPTSADPQASSQALPAAPYQRAVFTGILGDRRLVEASGLAASRIRPDRFWVLNDGGNGPLLFAIDERGSSQGHVSIQGVDNRDWEDLAAFTREDQNYLAIGDIGDNSGIRSSIFIHLVAEPERAGGQALIPQRSIEITLADEPHDFESLAYDPDSRSLLLLTKRTFPNLLYYVPLDSGDAVRIAPGAELNSIPQPTEEEMAADPKRGRYRSQPTAMDISEDGRSLIVLTYGHAYLFARRSGQAWSDAFAAGPSRLRLPPLPGGEAIAFDAAGRLLLTTEKWPAPVISFSPHP